MHRKNSNDKIKQGYSLCKYYVCPLFPTAVLFRQRPLYCNILKSHWSEMAPSTGKPVRGKWRGVIGLITRIDQQHKIDGFPLWYHLSFQVQQPVEHPHWESLPPLRPEVWHKRNVGCHANGRGGGDIQEYNRLPMSGTFVKIWLCSILYCKLLWWESSEWSTKRAQFCFSWHCVFWPHA